MTSAHFPINRIDRGGMNFDEDFIVTRCGALHFDLCQNFGSAVLVNSYRFHIHVLRFVVCFRSFSDHLPPASLLRLNLPNTMMLAQPCRFGIMVREWNSGTC